MLNADRSKAFECVRLGLADVKEMQGVGGSPTTIERQCMEWTLAHPLHDVDDIVELADSVFGQEADGILTRDRNVFRKNVTVASTVQLFDKGKEFLAVCRGLVDCPEAHELGYGDEIKLNPLLGYCWFDRGGYTTYANEEISNAKFHHVDLSLPAKQRVRLINEMIDQHILWASSWGIPVICSTSIRSDHDAFMRIHKKRGFTVNGSYAWIRTQHGLEVMNEKAQRR
jgi:hypothetical protein